MWTSTPRPHFSHFRASSGGPLTVMRCGLPLFPQLCAFFLKMTREREKKKTKKKTPQKDSNTGEAHEGQKDRERQRKTDKDGQGKGDAFSRVEGERMRDCKNSDRLRKETYIRSYFSGHPLRGCRTGGSAASEFLVSSHLLGGSM